MKRVPAFIALLLLTCTLSPLPNNRPDPPVITGPSEGYVDSTYTFTLLGKDPDSNNIRLRVAWGDADTSDWTPFIHSGETTQVSHAWPEPGTYTPRAQAMDWKDSVSEWSKGRVIEVSDGDFPSRLTGIIELGIEPTHMALLPDGSCLYVGGESEEWVWVLRTDDNSIVDSIPVCRDDGIQGLVASPDGNKVYVVCGDNRLLTIRAGDNAIVDSAMVMEDGSPTGLAMLPDGRRLYVSSWYGEHLMQVQTDPLRVTDSVNLGRSNVSGVLATEDGKYVYALCGPAQVASTESNHVVKKLGVGARAGACLPDTSLVYLCGSSDSLYVVRPSDHEVVRSIRSDYAHGLAAHPSSRWVYIAAWDGELSVLRTTDHKVIKSLRPGDDNTLVDVLCHPSGSLVYVADIEQNAILVLGY
jgi:DNA-binding beta-propeller fold protein YncE